MMQNSLCILQNIIILLQQMESIQLKNIQNIENSLSLLKAKIDKMSKLESQNQQTIGKLILSTIPVVDKKLKQSTVLETLQQKKTHYNDQSNHIRRKNQESRLINEKEVARSKQLLTLMKHHNSLHLKQSKKQNEEKIKKLKELNLNDKKIRKSLVKRKQQESQAKIQEFHQQKQVDLKMRREQQTKENEEKIQRLAQKMKQLAKQQLEMEQKVRASEENVGKLKYVIQKVDKMKCDEFTRFKEQLSPQNRLRNSKSISQAILTFAVKNHR